MNEADISRLRQKIATYQPSEATRNLVRATPKLFLVGISGAGKDTILHRLLQTGEYHATVSHTTRPPRANNGVMERDGVEYHFITLEQAEQMLDAGAYIEAKLYGTNVYGTSVSELQIAHDEHKIAVTDIEVQGVAEYMAIDPTTKAVFILPPSYEVWQERFMKRYGSESDTSDTEARMKTALFELEHALAMPYFDFVINDSLDEAVRDITGIVSGSEHVKEAARARDVAESIRKQLSQAYPQ